MQTDAGITGHILVDTALPRWYTRTELSFPYSSWLQFLPYERILWRKELTYARTCGYRPALMLLRQAIRVSRNDEPADPRLIPTASGACEQPCTSSTGHHERVHSATCGASLYLRTHGEKGLGTGGPRRMPCHAFQVRRVPGRGPHAALHRHADFGDAVGS